MKVEGVIELTNTSGKDISLTEYGMNLPYFTLKDTQIGYIYPKAFLVDMYSQNNSILFTFKSQFTKPVVIGKNGKITFTFSAQVEKPYRDFGGLRTLTFPFTFNEEGRSLRVTVTVDDKVGLIYAPNVAATLKKRNIFTVSEETGKLFLFAISDKPFSITLSHATEVALPPIGIENSCIQYLPVSCTGCGNIMKTPTTNEILAQRQKSAELVSVTFTKSISPACAKQKYANYNLNGAKNASYKAGYVISPSSNQLIPAMWRVAIDGSTTYMKDVSTQGVPYIYADALEYLAIPIKSCMTDEVCRKEADTLSTLDTSLTATAFENSPGMLTANPENITLSIHQEGRRFRLSVQNKTEQFLLTHPINLENNRYFTLNNQDEHIIPPHGELQLPLDTKVSLQTSNQPISLSFSINGRVKNLAFEPITITILAVIELLAYLFVVSLGITLFSSAGIILYNRINEKRAVQS